MIEPDSPAPLASQNKAHWPSILAAVGGILAIFIFLSTGGFFVLGGLMSFFTPESAEAGEIAMLFSYAAAVVFIGLLITPAVILAFRRLSGKSTNTGMFATRLTRRHAAWLLLVYFLVLMGGVLFSGLPQLDWLLMPILSVLALSLPVILLLWLGTKNLPPSSPQRNWTVFNLSMTFSPMVILVIELIAIFTGLILILFVGAVVIPDLPARLEEFTPMLETAQPALQIPEEEINAFLQTPLVVGVILFFTAALVPLVEESLKPVGLWLLAGRDLTPQDGWILGLLSGAGFALVENLGNLSAGQEWIPLTLARGGASALHMFNSAIIGYTFVLSRRQKRWRIVILAFLGTVLLHALWNGTAVIALIATLQAPTNVEPSWPIGYLLVMGLASVGTIWGIHRVNRKLVEETNIYIERENQINDRPDITTD